MILAISLLAATLTPLNELGPAPYAYGYNGGLWENGSNAIPPDHLAAGLQRAQRIQPLDAAGRPSADGRIVMVVAGQDEAQRIACGASNGSCASDSFLALASSDSRVERTSLVVLNAAEAGMDATRWIAANDPNYDRVRNLVLAPAGVTEQQVQAAWIDMSTDFPYSPLPVQDGDAYRLKGSLAAALRAMKQRYPNLQVAYLSSRVYGGFSETPRNPEPYAYESALSVRWIVVGQAAMMRIAAIGPYWDSRIGDLNYEQGSAPWVSWGPYLWAGTSPRRDGLSWSREDFDFDGEMLSRTGAAKAAHRLLDFLLAEPTAAQWFRAAGPPPRSRATRH